jgi:hypothetical protein
MKKVIGFVLIGLVLIMATGCASAHQVAPFPDQTKELTRSDLARVYVMRDSVLGSAIKMGVVDGDDYIGDTGPKSYLCWERQPGSTEVLGKAENTSRLSLGVQAGAVYYIRQHPQMGFFMARNKLELVSDEEGRKTLTKCKPPKNVSSQ